jgi:hypothetical protein
MNRRRFLRALVPVVAVGSVAQSTQPAPIEPVKPFEDGELLSSDRLNELVAAVNRQMPKGNA